MANVKASKCAQQDLSRILDYYRIEAGPATAAEFQRRFDVLFDRLADHPESCALRPQFGTDIRSGVVAPYVVLHRYDQKVDRVVILRVLQGRRRLSLDAI